MQFLSNQRIIDSLNISYGIDVDTLTYLPLGADVNAVVYKAQMKNHSYFVKLKRGHNHRLGLAVVGLLQGAGIQQIIPPVKTNGGHSAYQIEDFTLIVYPFIEGQDGFSRNLTDSQWFTLGKALKQIHEVNLPQSIRDQIRREAYSSKWREAVRSLYSHIESGTPGDEVALRLLKAMKDNKALILKLVDQAEKFAQQAQAQSPPFVLCHSDIHGGNVLIDKNDTLYIVDWDEPVLAPKERDLMFIGGGVANVWNNPHEEQLFYEGYGKTEVNTAILAYYRLERIVEDIAVYGKELLLTESGGEYRPTMCNHFIAMFEPNGVVDIAFRTVESVIR